MRKRYTKQDIEKTLNENGYILNECILYKLKHGEFIDIKSKIKVTCNNGHHIEIVFDSFKYGKRCAVCSKNAKFKIEDVRKYIENNGDKLLSKKYEGVNKKLKIKCRNNHVMNITFNKYRLLKHGCPKCSGFNHDKYKTKEEKRLANLARKKERMKTDNNFYISERIKGGFRQAMLNYSRTGKIWSIKKYPIDMKSIIEKLGKPPQDGKKYHIDHILPISAFDHNDLKMIKLCWHPDNLQWLEASENVKKFNKYDLKEFDKYILRTDAD